MIEALAKFLDLLLQVALLALVAVMLVAIYQGNMSDKAMQRQATEQSISGECSGK